MKDILSCEHTWVPILTFHDCICEKNNITQNQKHANKASNVKNKTIIKLNKTNFIYTTSLFFILCVCVCVCVCVLKQTPSPDP